MSDHREPLDVPPELGRMLGRTMPGLRGLRRSLFFSVVGVGMALLAMTSDTLLASMQTDPLLGTQSDTVISDPLGTLVFWMSWTAAALAFLGACSVALPDYQREQAYHSTDTAALLATFLAANGRLSHVTAKGKYPALNPFSLPPTGPSRRPVPTWFYVAGTGARGREIVHQVGASGGTAWIITDVSGSSGSGYM